MGIRVSQSGPKPNTFLMKAPMLHGFGWLTHGSLSVIYNFL